MAWADGMVAMAAESGKRRRGLVAVVKDGGGGAYSLDGLRAM